MSLRRFWKPLYLAALSVTCAELSLLPGHTPCSELPRVGVLAGLDQEPGPKAEPKRVRELHGIGRAQGMLQGSGRLRSQERQK